MSDLPVLYESDGRLARITLNRPEVLNAIDDALPAALESAVKRANSDQNHLVGNKRYKTATKVHSTGLIIIHLPKRSLKAKETCCENYSTGSWFSHPCNANF